MQTDEIICKLTEKNVETAKIKDFFYICTYFSLQLDAKIFECQRNAGSSQFP